MTIRLLCSVTDRVAVSVFFAGGAADYVRLETGRAPDAGTVDEFFNERPPGVTADGGFQFGLFEHDHLVGVIGMTIGYPTTTDAYVALLLLSPGIRGQGHGKTALAHATDHARARGATQQYIAVLDANPKGRAFWEREGFVLDQTFPPSDDIHTRHRMVRAI